MNTVELRSSLPGAAEAYQPPAAPWEPLDIDADAGAYLSVYLSDDLSRLPVRGVTRPGDNKSDPNLETGTYGLFSTCSQGMRHSLVERGIPYVIFLTRRAGERVVAGYYRVRWFFRQSSQNDRPDYALAADEVHFIDPPLRVRDLPLATREEMSKWFRLSKRVERSTAARVVAALAKRPDATASYLAEVDRLERFNAYRTGFRYVGWKRKNPFTWDSAGKYLSKPGGRGVRARNRSPSGTWRCTCCGHVFTNAALLRLCPECRTLASLEPA